MKTKQINTGIAEMLLVELPDGAYMVNINTHSFVGLHFMLYENGVNTPYKERLPDGNWSILSRADEVTEEQANSIVDTYPVSHNLDLTETYVGRDYTVKEKDDYNYDTEYPFDTAIESLYSLYEANGVDWTEWDKSRTYILIKQK